MTYPVSICVFCKDEESQLIITQHFDNFDEVKSSLDDVKDYPFVVSFKMNWDFSNTLIYSLLDYATETDLDIQIEVFPEGGEFDIYGLNFGEEEDQYTFEYSVYDNSFIEKLDKVDKILFGFNTGFTNLSLQDVASLSSVELSKIAAFFIAGFRFGTSEIFDNLSNDVRDYLLAISNSNKSFDADNRKDN